MRIRFTVCMGGAGFIHNAGDIADVQDAEAARLIQAGFAEPVSAATASRKRGRRAERTAAEPQDIETPEGQ